MDVSRQRAREDEASAPERGPRARTRRLMLETATRLMREGATPSVSTVAEAAGVSRATAYRYFPSQAALVEAVVAGALGPILRWQPEGRDAAARTDSLLAMAIPRIEAFQSTFEAALVLSLGRDVEGAGPRFTRGHRIDLLRRALAPLGGVLEPQALERLTQGLSLLFGVEALIVLKGIWGRDGREATDTVRWAAAALIREALREAERTEHSPELTG